MEIDVGYLLLRLAWYLEEAQHSYHHSWSFYFWVHSVVVVFHSSSDLGLDLEVEAQQEPVQEMRVEVEIQQGYSAKNSPQAY